MRNALKPFWACNSGVLYQGDVLEVLKELPAESVSCVMTSPPYYGLRDYGTAIWEGGDSNCNHENPGRKQRMNELGKKLGCGGGHKISENSSDPFKEICGLCGARRIDKQLGLEETHQEFLEKLWAIFDEVKRVLRKDGTCWINFGDSYSAGMPSELEKEISDVNRAWLAALLDGEGSFQIHKQIRNNSVPSYQADISVGMKDKAMCKKAYKLTGLGSFTLQNRGVWDWGVRGQEAGLLARIVYPYLVLKYPQAKLINALCENTKEPKNGRRTNPENLEEREKLLVLCKKLNQREIQDVNYSAPNPVTSNIPAKSLMMIPERFALGMIDRGWILRNKIIWFKPNGLPSSVRDRFSNRWEYVFFFSKSKKYWFDLDAVREKLSDASIERAQYPVNKMTETLVGKHKGPDNKKIMLKQSFNYRVRDAKKKPEQCPQFKASEREIREYTGRWGNDGKGMAMPEKWDSLAGKNPGDHWEISTFPFPEAHFATFPPDLVKKPIMAGCPEQICKKCGKARERISEISYKWNSESKSRVLKREKEGKHDVQTVMRKGHAIANHQTLGWTTCKCNVGFEPGIVMDIFAGSGTTCMVAKDLHRRYIGIDLNPEYLDIAIKRLRQETLFVGAGGKNV